MIAKKIRTGSYKGRSYGTTPQQRNWNRTAELTDRWSRLSAVERAELAYRIDVSNYFALSGQMPDGYVPVGLIPLNVIRLQRS